MMIRGFMKTTSLTALVAAAGLLMGNSVYAPANAADLGGDCCADLEARVAELEATTARKGNRVVSLQIYGQVNKAVLIYDTDFDSDAYVVDNDASGSRIGFRGSASMRPGWTAGYNIELDIQDAASNTVDDGAVVGTDVFDDYVNVSVYDDPSDQIVIRQNYVYIEGERLGRFSIGHQSAATDGIAGISLANTLYGPSGDHGTSLTVAAGLTGDPDDGYISLDLGDFHSDLDGPREDVVRYDSPSLYGFILSASWGDDDFWDVALRFRKEWNSIRFAAGIGYQDGHDDGGGSDFEIVSGSASLMHVPTGIFVTLAGGESEDDGDDAGEYWYVQAGIEKRWFSYGSTTVYGEYGDYNDFAVGARRSGTDDIPNIFVSSSEANRWGFGVVQSYDAAAMDIYANVAFWDFDWAETDATSFSSDISTVMVGARIRF
jgi:predicted porin